MLAGTGVIPAARAAHLPAELDERHVERRLHQAPFALAQDRLAAAHVLGVAVVRCDGIAFCSLVSAVANSFAKTFIMKGFIIERP